ncbi:MAG: hypothetical protein GF331_25020 [Chitinivibrionales bacterium]|nr:hypothetical protein [Chitinivibrionales bacterium]
MRIGIPRALSYYHFHAFWEAFFANLGISVVVSGPTTRDLIQAGAAMMPAEACLPLKCFAGHVASLANNADAIFIPRIVCPRIHPSVKLACPKLIGLPDVFRALCPDIDILSLHIDSRTGKPSRAYYRLAAHLGYARNDAMNAYESARAQACRAPAPGQQRRDPGTLAIGLAGHAYLVHDAALHGHIADTLRSLDCDIVYAPDGLRDNRSASDGPVPVVSWHFEQEILHDMAFFLAARHIHGIVYLLSFGCGAGSITSELIEYELRPHYPPKPLLRLLIDEHTAETALVTRLESFVDMIRERRS